MSINLVKPEGERQRALGTLLRTLRTRAGLTLEEVAERAGINRMRLGSYERGDRSISYDVAELMLAFYGHQFVVVPAGSSNPGGAPVDLPALLRRTADVLEAEGVREVTDAAFAAGTL